MTFFLSFIWGLSFIFNKILLPNWSIWFIVFARCLFGFLAIFAFVKLSRGVMDLQKYWHHGLVMGLSANVVPFVAIVYGQKFIPAGLASIINACTPFTTWAVMLIFSSEEKIVTHRLVGMILGILGVITLIGWEVLLGNFASVGGMALVFLATCCYATQGYYARRNLQNMPPKNIATVQLFFSSLIMFLLVLCFDNPLQYLDLPSEILWRDLAIFIIFGSFSTGIAYLLYFNIVANAGAVNAALVTMLVPVTAILLAIFYLQEELHLNHFLGIFIIFTGLIGYDGRLIKKLMP